ncbi:hypothetical protein [Nitrosomonas sp.]|nr:hypothetical protein [Nitrosomonas sp.]
MHQHVGGMATRIERDYLLPRVSRSATMRTLPVFLLTNKKALLLN